MSSDLFEKMKNERESPLHVAKVRVFRKLMEMCGDSIDKWTQVEENLDQVLLSTDDIYDDWRDGYRRDHS